MDNANKNGGKVWWMVSGPGERPRYEALERTDVGGINGPNVLMTPAEVLARMDAPGTSAFEGTRYAGRGTLVSREVVEIIVAQVAAGMGLVALE